jgi:hypothetical protein
METADFQDIRYALDDEGIVTVTISSTKRRNAISGLTSLELRYAAQHFANDDRAHAMILTGENDPERDSDRQAFSSGGYFSPDAYTGLPDDLMAEIDHTDIAMKATVLEFFACDKPVLAAVNGLAIGGGFTLPLAVADQIYLSEHALASPPSSAPRSCFPPFSACRRRRSCSSSRNVWTPKHSPAWAWRTPCSPTTSCYRTPVNVPCSSFRHEVQVCPSGP